MAAIAGENVVIVWGSTTLSNVLSASGPGATADVVDQTDLDSTAEDVRASKFVKGGEVRVQAHYHPSAHAALMAKVGTEDDGTTTINNDDGTSQGSFTWTGILTGMEPGGVGVGSNLVADFTWKVVGHPTAS